MALFQEVVDLLVKGIALPAKYRNHSLTGNYQGWMECHIQPDWLLIWKYEEGELVLCLLSMGSHADLFGKNRKPSFCFLQIDFIIFNYGNAGTVISSVFKL